jgi:hypothetical protein
VTFAPRLQRTVVFSLAAMLALTLAPALTRARSATAAAASSRTGGVGSQQPGIAYESAAQMNKDLDSMVAASMTWVRADFYWSAIQGAGKSSYAWGPTDAFVKAANVRGIHVVALVDYTPAWARSGNTDKYPPRDPHDYASFVHVAALRYGPMGVHTWEIWNEPNFSMFWAPKADPVAYTAMLKLAYPAIKSADATATVISGGVAPASDNGRDVAPITFITDIYANGGKGSFDAAGYHPYSFPYVPMYKADWNTFYRTPDFHAVMTKNGDDAKQVWGTEVGFPTGTNARP